MTPGSYHRAGFVRFPRAIIPSAILVLLGACQVIGWGGSGSAAGDGPGSAEGVVYQGVLSIGGGDLPAALEIIRVGSRNLRGALQTAAGVQAEGEGRLRGRSFNLRLTYGGECPGWMVLDGEWDPETNTIAGHVTASDCTGPAEGDFRFSAG